MLRFFVRPFAWIGVLTVLLLGIYVGWALKTTQVSTASKLHRLLHPFSSRAEAENGEARKPGKIKKAFQATTQKIPEGLKHPIKATTQKYPGLAHPIKTWKEKHRPTSGPATLPPTD